MLGYVTLFFSVLMRLENHYVAIVHRNRYLPLKVKNLIHFISWLASIKSEANRLFAEQQQCRILEQGRKIAAVLRAMNEKARSTKSGPSLSQEKGKTNRIVVVEEQKPPITNLLMSQLPAITLLNSEH